MTDKPLKVARLELGKHMTANSFVMWNEDTKDAVIFDAGFDDDKLINFIKDKGLKVNKIFLTHGHFDHIGGLERLREETGAEVVISKKEADYLTDPEKNMSTISGLGIVKCKPAEIQVSEGDEIEVEPGMVLKVMETPGHTGGSICYLGDKFVVSGDVLFKDSIGRTDFPTGNFAEMMHSLKRLLELSDDTVVFPGHGEVTTIGEERAHNPFLS